MELPDNIAKLVEEVRRFQPLATEAERISNDAANSHNRAWEALVDAQQVLRKEYTSENHQIWRLAWEAYELSDRSYSLARAAEREIHEPLEKALSKARNAFYDFLLDTE
jgi:predicted  nucleic acid-binding Zn-ribbon protein